MFIIFQFYFRNFSSTFGDFNFDQPLFHQINLMKQNASYFWVRLNYINTHHHPPPPTTSQNISTTITHHPPPSAKKYAPPPTTSQNISTATYHHPPSAKIYPPTSNTTHQLPIFFYKKPIYKNLQLLSDVRNLDSRPSIVKKLLFTCIFHYFYYIHQKWS